MRRKLILLLVALIILTMNTTALAKSYEPNEYFSFLDKKQISLDIIEIIKNNDKSIITLDDISKMSTYEMSSLHLLPINFNSLYKSDLYSTRSSFSYTVNRYNKKQKNSYYCGPAATLQALYTAGVGSNVSGSTSYAKQTTLASELYTSTSGTWIDRIPPVMNNRTNRYRQWTRNTFSTSSSSKDIMEYWIRSNHAYNNCVIYLLKPGSLSYYSGNPGGHYISGSGIHYTTGNTTDYTNIYLDLDDPHYNNAYYGQHYENFNNVNLAMHNYHIARGPANMVY